jgi:hypothetical protein
MKKTTIIKIQETINIATIFVAGITGIWNFWTAVDIAGISQVLNSILELLLKKAK